MICLFLLLDVLKVQQSTCMSVLCRSCTVKYPYWVLHIYLYTVQNAYQVLARISLNCYAYFIYCWLLSIDHIIIMDPEMIFIIRGRNDLLKD